MLEHFDTMSAERLRAIGELLVATSGELVEAWERASRREQPEADEVRRQELRNSLPAFLKAFGAGLMKAESQQDIGRRFAIEHGIQRWELGWNIVEVLRDFMILRRCVLLRLRQELDLSGDETEALAAIFDEAAAESVQAYAEQREGELLDANEALNESNERLRRFAHVVAHEIRSPAATIQMAARLLAERTQGEVPEELGMMREAADFIAAIVTDTLAYSKLEASDETVREVDLNVVFEDALTHLAYLMRKRQAEVSADSLPGVVGRPSQLLQLFLNLLENAIKYSPERPRIRVFVSEDTAEHLVLAFRDRGRGVPPEHQESIFRFLTRVDQDEAIPGSGIGLAICRRVAEQHGGRIWVESEVGAGSTFFVSISRTRPER